MARVRGRKRIDLTGRKYTNWKVLREAERHPSGKSMWVCQCVCGTIRTVSGSSLQSKQSRSCGKHRHKKKLQRIPTKKHTPKTLKQFIDGVVLRRIKYSAVSRGKLFEIHDALILALARRPCHYCGGMDERKLPGLRGKQGMTEKSNGLDRVNNELDYTENNVVPCCGKCNHMKRNLKVENWLEHMLEILKHCKVLDSKAHLLAA